MAIKINIKILAIQELWVISNSNEFRSINHPSFKQLFPNYSTFRPRVLFYISREYIVNLAPILLLDPDCIIIDVIDLNIQLINIYNASHHLTPFFENFQTSRYHSISLLDFNIV